MLRKDELDAGRLATLKLADREPKPPKIDGHSNDLFTFSASCALSLPSVYMIHTPARALTQNTGQHP